MNRFLPLLMLFASFSVSSEEIVLRSASQQAVLLELFTSEGCSSCPPADRWFSRLLDHPDLWSGLVPVAFHVDYWNYLGWEDRFSQSAYSARQRRYKTEGAISGVYTPGIVVSGGEWRSWRRSSTDFEVEGPPVGVLELKSDDGAFVASFLPGNSGGDWSGRLHIAILGFGMKTPVKAGENSGRLLNHDFVVIGYNSFRSNHPEWRGRLPRAQFADEAQRLAVVAWVSTEGDQRPVQAVGGWVPKR